MFIQLLEGLHKDDAKLLIAVKDKALNKKYKGLLILWLKTHLDGTKTTKPFNIINIIE